METPPPGSAHATPAGTPSGEVAPDAASADPLEGLPRWWPWAAAVALFVTGFALYAHAIGFAFVDWDDLPHVVENPWIRAITLENLFAIATRPISHSFFPLQSYSYMLDYAFWELDPRGYHLHSVLLNALNGALAFWVLLRITRRPSLALIAAFLFTVHHSHVSSVVWVSARKELLFTTFLLLSLGTYLHARRDGGFDRRAYAGSLVLFAIGATAKTTIALYPLFFLLVDWFEDARLAPSQRRGLAFHVATKLPYLLLAAPVVWMNFQVQLVADAAREGDALDYLLVKGQASWRYLWLLLGVIPGQPIYDPPPTSRLPFWAFATVLPLLAVLYAWWIAMRRGAQQIALGLAWLIVGMIPPLVFPLTTYMADRYLYAPSLGFCWILAAGFTRITRIGERPGAWRLVALALLTALPALWYAANARGYSSVWRHSTALWRYAVKKSDDGRAATALSAALLRAGRVERAEEVLLGARALGPNGYLHLAIVYLEQERIDDALHASERALRIAGIDPPNRRDGGKLLYVRGVILARLGLMADAVEAWESALVVDPGNPDARRALEDLELVPEGPGAGDVEPGDTGPPEAAGDDPDAER